MLELSWWSYSRPSYFAALLSYAGLKKGTKGNFSLLGKSRSQVHMRRKSLSTGVGRGWKSEPLSIFNRMFLRKTSCTLPENGKCWEMDGLQFLSRRSMVKCILFSWNVSFARAENWVIQSKSRKLSYIIFQHINDNREIF